jgi:hypothetical protein
VGIQQVGDWPEARLALSKAPKDLEWSIKKAVYQEALFFAKAMKLRLGAGVPPPLARPRGGGRNAKGRFTKGGGGGSKPLNATGDMRNSIGVLPEGPAFEAFIGIGRNGTTGKGKRAWNASLAAIHENGAVIVMAMTPKQRAFLAMLFSKSKPKSAKTGAAPSPGAVRDAPHKGILVIKIPARPFIRPTFEENAPGAAARFYGRLAKFLGGALGAP